MAAKKTVTKTKKKTAKKAAAKAADKAAKKTNSKAAPKTGSKKTPKPAAAAKSVGKKSAGKKGASSLAVNMSHVFALRPRATTSFKAGDFSTAKYQLQDESYSDIHAAAKAVVEKALELTHGSPKKGRKGHF